MDLSTYRGNCFLGIDAGSTTTKAALVAEDGTLLYSFYQSNNGDPLGTTISAIKDIYRHLPDGVQIVHSCSTGYGEVLIKSALLLDEGEVETISHYYAASFFEPDVDCILDIGGQDMKCIKIKNQTVDSVQSVSYTHLDVYKRQLQNRCKFIRSIGLITCPIFSLCFLADRKM